MARSLNTGIRSKRFHLAINGKIATVSSSAVRGRTYASRHVRKKIGGAFFSAGVILSRAWSQGKLSGCVDTYANAERLSRTHSTHSTRKGFFDMESDPVALRSSGFDSVHVYIPRSVINRFSDEHEQKRIRNLHCTPGTKDDVILHWARMMLPFSDRPLQLPRLVIDEMIMMFCAHLSRTYQGRSQPPEAVTGGLAIWQQDRAIEVLDEHLDGDLTLADLAKECALSAGRFMRAFKRSFGVPVRRYLHYKRVEAAKALLLHSNDSLLTVALEVGFTDQLI